MEALGRHILVELYNCDNEKINDVAYIESSMLAATRASGATIISHNFHKFSPHGVSGVVVIAESHVSIHSWPEYNYAAIDIFTCGDTIDPMIIRDTLKKDFQAETISSREIKRGMIKPKAGKKLLHKPQQQILEK
ncbi:adenosylmethionine decarboxylase [Fodinibius halophilus]|uniref:S-adenosylmethionine decarboxylase proenzyme n=1 Tax=Fodinibius halophilus TaxID=1736908 RepID=A0A6M1TGH6_9BACT|nr:adenosylmethionine decarboxylase [Fodinibius halophilus]NGP89894.1 S-adenosylmethionine decarboxylase proenzyme [Fodinibius halophilus]